MRKIKKSKWIETLQPGILVRPNKKIFLTPLKDGEDADWLEWDINEIAVVLPQLGEHVGLLVLAPQGIGFCFVDEVKQI